MSRTEPLREQALLLFARWEKLLDRDPRRVAREARILFGWVERLDPASQDERELRRILWESCVMFIARADSRRR